MGAQGDTVGHLNGKTVNGGPHSLNLGVPKIEGFQPVTRRMLGEKAPSPGKF
jgi:hypothetical protein